MENGEAPPNTILCARCGTACDLGDNFCRQCGLALRADAPRQLPVPHEGILPAVWRPPVPTMVVRGAAVVAAGTLAEMMVRRLVRSVFGGGAKRSRETTLPARSANGAVAPREDAMPEDTQMVSETLLLRRIRFRR